MPRISIGTLGGTITMTPNESHQGVVPTAGAREVLNTVPGLIGIADLRAETLCKKPGASLDMGDVLSTFDWAQARVAEGAEGVVLVQGTDTVEEVAYLLDLLWPHDEPLVITGAMRDPGQLSADGPANLHAAVAVAADPGCRGLGVTVVMNNEIHAARRVSKDDTSSVGAFTSGPFGLLGRLHEGHVTVANRPTRLPPLPRPVLVDQIVSVIGSELGDHGALLDHLLQTGAADGLVIAGFGAGHVHEKAVRALSASGLPVVLASRTGCGPVLETTYAFPGSELDLISRGAVPAGWLTARRARLLLLVLVATDTTMDGVRSTFGTHGGMP